MPGLKPLRVWARAEEATRVRGLIIVRSAPVSSRSWAVNAPLILTSTMMRWPGVYLITVVPLGFAAVGVAVLAAAAGALRNDSGTAALR